MTQVTIVKVVEGESHLVIRVNMTSDGTGELENFPVLSPSDLVPPRANNRPAFRIMQIWYGLVWYDVTFKAGTVTPAHLWTLARDGGGHVDFRGFGGIVDQNVYSSPPSDDSGILTISTNGFAASGSQGSIILELRKTNTL